MYVKYTLCSSVVQGIKCRSSKSIARSLIKMLLDQFLSAGQATISLWERGDGERRGGDGQRQGAGNSYNKRKSFAQQQQQQQRNEAALIRDRTLF